MRQVWGRPGAAVLGAQDGERPGQAAQGRAAEGQAEAARDLDGREPGGGREGVRPVRRAYEAKYPKAAECLVKDREALLAFYDFPAEHWLHIRTTNPIESTFATVRLRTTKTKGSGSRTASDDGLQALPSAQRRWRPLNGSTRLGEVIRGVRSSTVSPRPGRRLMFPPSTTFDTARDRLGGGILLGNGRRLANGEDRQATQPSDRVPSDHRCHPPYSLVAMVNPRWPPMQAATRPTGFSGAVGRRDLPVSATPATGSALTDGTAAGVLSATASRRARHTLLRESTLQTVAGIETSRAGTSSIHRCVLVVAFVLAAAIASAPYVTGAALAGGRHADPELEALLPTTLGGVALTVESQAGTDLSTQSAAFDAFLASLGKTRADFTLASAYAQGGLKAEVGAWRVKGADPRCCCRASRRPCRPPARRR